MVDWVFTIGSLLFVIALLPKFIGFENKVLNSYRFIGILTGVVLMVFGFTYFTIGLHWSGYSSLLLGAMWLSIGLDKNV